MKKSNSNRPFDIQGHRGCRGLLPENTIEGFLHAIDLGVTTIELDVVITKDLKVLVSHLCLDANGNEIGKNEQGNFLIFGMNMSETKAYDCGSLRQKEFPNQTLKPSRKPSLKEVFYEVQQHTDRHGLATVKWNIELKSEPEKDGIFQPDPSQFCELVFQEIMDSGQLEHINIQSFDFRILRYFHEQSPHIPLGALVGNELGVLQNLKNLGFYPDVYSCEHHLLSQTDVDYLHENGMLAIPWTVNEKNDMQQLIDWGVDGIITDYPDRLIEVMNQNFS